ncbi:NUDIX domain-containing protein [Candidatus Woesearchaeota archaeon]|nr:MAG: NUDIX domain-containing protein [Candidatus Woesearchaeota archaeon]
MRYTSLIKKEREKIFELFIEKEKLKFSDIEKALRIRSNMVSYHLQQMQKENLIEKKGLHYLLTKQAERYLPLLSHITGKQLSPLPVVLVAIANKNKILLLKRNKRPYQHYWGLIGGKMLLEESFAETAMRLVREKTGLLPKAISINSILHERVEDNLIKHSFILFFMKATVNQSTFKASAHGTLQWFPLKKIDKEKTIPSDLWLIQKKLNSKIPVTSAVMSDKEGVLSAFNIQ